MLTKLTKLNLESLNESSSEVKNIGRDNKQNRKII